MVHSSGSTREESSGGGVRFRTPLLDFYHGRMQDLMQRSSGRIVAVPGDGIPFVEGAGGLAAGPPPRSTEANGKLDFSPRCGWRDFLHQYALDLQGLPAMTDPAWKSFVGLSAAQVEAWATVMPIAAQMIRQAEAAGARTESGGEAAMLETARSWAVAMVHRRLDSR